VIVRVTEPGRPAFQLRKGEEGLSVFILEGVDPPLTESEILESFRPGSLVIRCPAGAIEARGLQVVPILGADVLPPRLREAHAEIRPGPGLTRLQFKEALKELE
jgi:hypothetical protein